MIRASRAIFTALLAVALLAAPAHAAGYRPFLDPLPWDGAWLWLMLPLVLAISIVYKAIKVDNLAHVPRQALFLAAQIVVFMVLAAAALWLIT